MIHELLRHAIAQRASDVHLNVGSRPIFRIDTEIQTSEFATLTTELMSRIVKLMMNERRFAQFEAKRDADFAYEIPCVGRFRVNAHYQRNSIALSIRIVSDKIRSLEELALPEIVAKLTQTQRGLVLVTGPTGSGKSTTLAAMINTINRRDRGRIVTLEDPIEFTFAGDKCAIEQREVGNDVPDFASGLKHVLRQDPNTILVGEMRDLETASAAITAAETGHLVLSTLHTHNAPQTVERIVDMYPTNQQNQIRTMLANTLQAVISQILLRRADQPGMIAATEIMLGTPAVRNCIRENRAFEIPNIIETSRGQGMQTMDTSIKQLYANNQISRETAVAAASHPERLERALVA